MKKNIIKFLKNPIIFMVLVIILITVSTLFLNNNYVILEKKAEEKKKKEIQNFANDFKKNEKENVKENVMERKIVKEIVANDVKLYKENDKYSVSYAIDNNGSKKYTVDNIVYFENKFTSDDIYEESTIKPKDGIVFSEVESKELSDYIEKMIKENKEIILYKKIYSENKKEELGIVEIKVKNKIENQN